MIFTVDVEDWSQSVLDRNNPITRRVWDNTIRLLEILEEHNAKGTFFIQGKVAEAYPILVEKIHRSGHEVASHAYSHNNIAPMGRNIFNGEIERSVQLLQDITGEKVIGFRAPNFSIHEDMFEWYCETLHSHGIRYDSSLFEINISKYNMRGDYSLAAFRRYNLHQFYLSHAEFGGVTFPFFGGGYFRLYPYWFTHLFSKQLSPKSGVFYMHPYELGKTEYSEIKSKFNIPLKYKITQFVGRKSVEKKLHKLLRHNDFTSFKEQYYTPHATQSSRRQDYTHGPIAWQFTPSSNR